MHVEGVGVGEHGNALRDVRACGDHAAGGNEGERSYDFTKQEKKTGNALVEWKNPPKET